VTARVGPVHEAWRTSGCGTHARGLKDQRWWDPCTRPGGLDGRTRATHAARPRNHGTTSAIRAWRRGSTSVVEACTHHGPRSVAGLTWRTEGRRDGRAIDPTFQTFIISHLSCLCGEDLATSCTMDGATGGAASHPKTVSGASVEFRRKS